MGLGASSREAWYADEASTVSDSYQKRTVMSSQSSSKPRGSLAIESWTIMVDPNLWTVNLSI